MDLQFFNRRSAMLKQKVVDAINAQINREMYSGFLYMSMSASAGRKGMKGFANWFMVQFHEEMFHAMKMYEYVLKQGGAVVLKAIAEPPATFTSELDMFEQTLKHEIGVTQNINDLMDLAIAEKDHATQIFLQWYITEQIEEEENDNDIITQLKLIGDNPQGLMMLDSQLAARMTTIVTDFSKGVMAPAAAKAAV
jgi:ferritin